MSDDHFSKALSILASYDRERIAPSGGPVKEREAYFSRLIAEAQVHATLAVAEELERHRVVGWARPL